MQYSYRIVLQCLAVFCTAALYSAETTRNTSEQPISHTPTSSQAPQATLQEAISAGARVKELTRAYAQLKQSQPHNTFKLLALALELAYATHHTMPLIQDMRYYSHQLLFAELIHIQLHESLFNENITKQVDAILQQDALIIGKDSPLYTQFIEQKHTLLSLIADAQAAKDALSQENLVDAQSADRFSALLTQLLNAVPKTSTTARHVKEELNHLDILCQISQYTGPYSSNSIDTALQQLVQLESYYRVHSPPTAHAIGQLTPALAQHLPSRPLATEVTPDPLLSIKQSAINFNISSQNNITYDQECYAKQLENALNTHLFDNRH